MGKIGPYNLSDVSTEAENFKEEVSDLLNYGKMQYAVVTGTPTWVANAGEGVFQMPASGGTTFWFYRNTAWVAGWSVTI